MNLGLKPSKSEVDPVSHMRFISSHYAARGLIYHWVTGGITYSPREFETFFALSMADHELSPERLERAFALLDQIDLHYGDNFQFL